MQKMLAKVRRVATFWTDDFWLCAGERRRRSTLKCRLWRPLAPCACSTRRGAEPRPTGLVGSLLSLMV